MNLIADAKAAIVEMENDGYSQWPQLMRVLLAVITSDGTQGLTITEIEADAATLRGYIATYGETPSMTASSRDHWKARAEKAEAEVMRRNADDRVEQPDQETRG
jgi:hypothetical protein